MGKEEEEGRENPGWEAEKEKEGMIPFLSFLSALSPPLPPRPSQLRGPLLALQTILLPPLFHHYGMPPLPPLSVSHPRKRVSFSSGRIPFLDNSTHARPHFLVDWPALAATVVVGAEREQSRIETSYLHVKCQPTNSTLKTCKIKKRSIYVEGLFAG